MQRHKGFIVVYILILLTAVGFVGMVLYLQKDHAGARPLPLSLDDLRFAIRTDISPQATTYSATPLVVGLPPDVNAGEDISVKSKNYATLTGRAVDADGGALSYFWKKLSGNKVTIQSPSSKSTLVTGLKNGRYVFRLIVADTTGLKSADDLFVTVSGVSEVVANSGTSKVSTTHTGSVNTPPTTVTEVALPMQNIPPFAGAGPDQEIVLPTDSVVLSGAGSNDSDGNIVSYYWTKVFGAEASISSPSSVTTSVSNLTEGSYIFRLTVTDNQGAMKTDDVTIIIRSVVAPPASSNIPPIANAGPDEFITLPINLVTLDGSNSFDGDGFIVHYSWMQISGEAVKIDPPDEDVADVYDLKKGSYIFRLTVTDNQDATSVDDVVITVSGN